MSQELHNSHQTYNNLIPGQSNLKLITSLLPTMSDDVFDTIRAIVPPPPALRTLCTSFRCHRPNSTLEDSSPHEESLYTRRPTEESLLDKVKSPSYSAHDARIKLEELFFQLIEPNKYTNEDELTDCISKLMLIWPKDTALQEQALQCFVRMSKQNDDFCLPQSTLNSIVDIMNVFPRNETIYRCVFKLLMEKKIYNQLNCKIDLAKLVFNALCNIHGVDYFILLAKNIVKDLEPPEKSQLRAEKQYILMLLDFPNRQNETITIMLRWCALDILVLLADSSPSPESWYHTKLQRLCQVPEFEDRCRFILEKTFPSINYKVSESFMHSPALLSITDKSLNMEHNPPGSATHQPPQLNNGQLKNLANGSNNLEQEKLLQGNQYNIRHLSRSPDHSYDERQFSEDETTQETVILSNSPPPEVCAQTFKQNEIRNTNSGVQRIPGVTETKASSGNMKNNSLNKSASTVEAPMKENYVLKKCIICKEPKGKQTLLVKQFKQIAHCLHQPSNLLLFNCLEANICENHRT